MGKAVLISIRPEWVEKIANEWKTIEVRKTKPHLDTPFKCYIYCTKDKKDPDRLWVLREQIRKEYDGLAAVCAHLRAQPDLHSVGNGHVVGEFVCDKIDVIQRMGIPANFYYCYLSLNEWGNDDIETEIRDIMGSCIPKERLNSYAGKTPVLYAWHISDLEIYDSPKQLSEFKGLRKTKFGYEPVEIKRPPQSWCYVEELK